MMPKINDTTRKTTAQAVVILSKPSSSPFGVPNSFAAPPIPPNPSPLAVCKRTVITRKMADISCIPIKNVFIILMVSLTHPFFLSMDSEPCTLLRFTVELIGISAYAKASADREPTNENGGEGGRTPDLSIANAALSQLSYTPKS